MATPFIGEIRMFGFNFPPRDWAFCNGASIAINQNTSLYSLIRDQFGGTSTNFNLPNLQGRTPIGPSDYYGQGYYGGLEEVTLAESEIPSHSHDLYGTAAAGTASVPDNSSLMASTTSLKDNFEETFAVNPADTTALHQDSIAIAGGNIPHTNMQPSLVINFCISLEGLYPPRN